MNGLIDRLIGVAACDEARANAGQPSAVISTLLDDAGSIRGACLLPVFVAVSCTIWTNTKYAMPALLCCMTRGVFVAAVFTSRPLTA